MEGTSYSGVSLRGLRCCRIVDESRVVCTYSSAVADIFIGDVDGTVLLWLVAQCRTLTDGFTGFFEADFLKGKLHPGRA